MFWPCLLHRRRALLFAFALFMMLGTASARTEPRPPQAPEALRNTVVIRLGERFAVEYERAVHPAVSVFVGPAVVAGIVSGNDNMARNELGIGSTLGARFFVRGEAPEGLFIGPLLYLGYSHTSEGGQAATGLRLSSGAMVGYTAVFFDILAVSLGVGASYLNVTHVVNAADAPGPVETNLRFALGVAF